MIVKSLIIISMFVTDIKKPTLVGLIIHEMVPVGGLEPPRPKATDFESVMSTNSIIPAFHVAT
jgi:hypothetical protein